MIHIIVTTDDKLELSYSDNHTFGAPIDSWYDDEGNYVIEYEIDDCSHRILDSATEALENDPAVISYKIKKDKKKND